MNNRNFWQNCCSSSHATSKCRLLKVGSRFIKARDQNMKNDLELKADVEGRYSILSVPALCIDKKDKVRKGQQIIIRIIGTIHDMHFDMVQGWVVYTRTHRSTAKQTIRPVRDYCRTMTVQSQKLTTEALAEAAYGCTDHLIRQQLQENPPRRKKI